MTVRTYASPQGFREALEQRQRADAAPGEFARRRQLLVFDRFLARVAAVFGEAATLKGGLVLELRLARARTTRDVDLRMMGSSDEVLPRLQAAGRADLGDFMQFEVGPDREHPEIGHVRYGGFRFRAACTLAGRAYGDPFGVDVAFGEPIFGVPDRVVAGDVLGFAGIAPPTIQLVPIETHVAEKLHAYTMPRSRVNSRVKDLPDIALLATLRPLSAASLRAALEQTFSFRGTHVLPGLFPDPPSVWAVAYAAMAKENRLPWSTLERVTLAAREFLGPVLAGEVGGVWDPRAAVWRAT